MSAAAESSLLEMSVGTLGYKKFLIIGGVNVLHVLRMACHFLTSSMSLAVQLQVLYIRVPVFISTVKRVDVSVYSYCSSFLGPNTMFILHSQIYNSLLPLPYLYQTLPHHWNLISKDIGYFITKLRSRT